MPRQMPTTLRPRILALKPAEEASSSRSKSAAVVPDVNAPSRTVRPPFRLFDPFSAGLDQFQPTAFMAPVRTSVATEFNSGEHAYNTIKPRSPSIRRTRQVRRKQSLRSSAASAEGFSSGNPRRIRRIPSLEPSLRRHLNNIAQRSCTPSQRLPGP